MLSQSCSRCWHCKCHHSLRVPDRAQVPSHAGILSHRCWKTDLHRGRGEEEASSRSEEAFGWASEHGWFHTSSLQQGRAVASIRPSRYRVGFNESGG